MGRMRASLTPIGGPITDTHQPMVRSAGSILTLPHAMPAPMRVDQIRDAQLHDAAEQQGLTCSCVAVDDSCPAL